MKIIAMTVFCIDNFIGIEKSVVGGNSLNFAAQCVKSEAGEVSVLGAVGTDTAGIRILNFLENIGISTKHIYSTPDDSASNKIYITPDGERYFKADSWTGGAFERFIISENDWPFILSHDIIAIPATDPNLEETLDKAYGNCDVVLDFLDSRDYGYVIKELERVSVGFISGNEETLEALKPFAEKHVKPIVVTMGENGSAALYGNKVYRQKAVPVEKIIDTTGCGDAFQAAFTVSWFRNHDIKYALKCGAEAASKVLSFYGGVIEN